MKVQNEFLHVSVTFEELCIFLLSNRNQCSFTLVFVCYHILLLPFLGLFLFVLDFVQVKTEMGEVEIWRCNFMGR